MEITSEDDVNILQDNLYKLEEWSNDWLLHFRPQKCKVLDVSLKDKVMNKYRLGGVELEHVLEEKDLGIFFYRKLKFDTHISTKAPRPVPWAW